jgi:magnesium-transporting ATPase (P-type)
VLSYFRYTARLETSPDGFSTVDAERRLAEFGENVLKVRKNTPEIVKFLEEFTNFFNTLLIVGGCLPLLSDYLEPDSGNLYITCGVFGVMFLNSSFAYLQEHKSEKIMESFQRMLPPTVRVLWDRERAQVAAEDLVPGDRLNNAPALKNADMGVAMGLNDTDVAKETIDMVLKGEIFVTIVGVVEERRTIFDTNKKFIVCTLIEVWRRVSVL